MPRGRTCPSDRGQPAGCGETPRLCRDWPFTPLFPETRHLGNDVRVQDPPEGKTWSLEELQQAFERYSELVNASDLAPSTKTTYLVHADRFVCWLAGQVRIGPSR